jgi:hypothetical protein
MQQRQKLPGIGASRVSIRIWACLPIILTSANHPFHSSGRKNNLYFIYDYNIAALYELEQEGLQFLYVRTGATGAGSSCSTVSLFLHALLVPGDEECATDITLNMGKKKGDLMKCIHYQELLHTIVTLKRSNSVPDLTKRDAQRRRQREGEDTLLRKDGENEKRAQFPAF